MYVYEMALKLVLLCWGHVFIIWDLLLSLFVVEISPNDMQHQFFGCEACVGVVKERVKVRLACEP